MKVVGEAEKGGAVFATPDRIPSCCHIQNAPQHHNLCWQHYGGHQIMPAGIHKGEVEENSCNRNWKS